jgi:hypothetical protein
LEQQAKLDHETKKYQTQIDELTAKNHELVQTLTEALENVREENKKLAEDLASGRESRRLQGLHKQLKMQFDEKCKVLDETRRELFTAQEKIVASQHQLELNELNANKAHEEHCKTLLADAAREIEIVEKEYQEEIANLYSLVDNLSNVTQNA